MSGEIGRDSKWLRILSGGFFFSFNVNIGSDIKFWFLDQTQDIGRISGTCLGGLVWFLMSKGVN